MRDMDVKMLNAVGGIVTEPETRMPVLELQNNSETEEVKETKTITRRTKK